MDFSSHWRGRSTTQHPEPAPHSQLHGFTANLSSHFRRPAKIVKTGSRGNSPKTLSRRRTTASHTTRHRSASKGSISNYGGPGADHNLALASTRPTSWHPNSFNPASAQNWTLPYQYPDAAFSMHLLSHPFTTTQVNGLITPLTQPSSGDSCYNETFTPLEEMPFQYAGNPYLPTQQAGCNPCWLPQDHLPRQTPADQPPVYRDTHLLEQQPLPFTYLSAPDGYTGTAPPTPDFFPTSTYRIGDEQKAQTSKGSGDEVLVGMGLYDVPSPPNSTGLLGNHITLPHRVPPGKGLKLEETFEPSSIVEDSDDDDDSSTEELEDDEDDSSIEELEDDEEEEEEFADSVPAGQENDLQEAETISDPTRLADQSFFFDNDAEDDALLHQPYNQHFCVPSWGEVANGTPFEWI